MVNLLSEKHQYLGDLSKREEGYLRDISDSLLEFLIQVSGAGRGRRRGREGQNEAQTQGKDVLSSGELLLGQPLWCVSQELEHGDKVRGVRSEMSARRPSGSSSWDPPSIC